MPSQNPFVEGVMKKGVPCPHAGGGVGGRAGCWVLA